MADLPGNKKAAPRKEQTLLSGKKVMWEKGKHTWLALYWDNPIKHVGSGQATVTLKDGASLSHAHHSPPHVIRIDQRAGSLENNTGETIRYVLT